MGHTRLGAVPKTRKWNELVGQIAGPALEGSAATSAINAIDSIAARTLNAAQKALDRAANDQGVRHTFYLLTRIALASRTPDWKGSLANLGIHLSEDSTVFDLTVEVQEAVDQHLSQSSAGSSDLSEMAQQAAGEAIAGLVGPRTISLFGTTSADIQNAIRSLSTKKGFGELGQRFFGRFIARFLNFYLSHVTAATLGSPRLQQLGDVTQFNETLKTHCDQSARIVRDFCGEWYSKTEPDRFPYRGLLRCAECGAPLLSISHSNGHTHHDYYVCRSAHGSRTRWDAEKGKFQWRIKNNSCPCRRMRRERVDAILDDLIGTRLSDPELLYRLMRDQEQALTSGDNRTRIDRLANEIADAEERKRRLKVLYVKGDLDEAEYDTAKSRVEVQIAAARERMKEIKPEVPNVSRKALAELLSPFSEWDMLRQEDRRALLVSVVPVFKIGGYGNGRIGRAARTEIVAKGFYLKLTGEAPQRSASMDRGHAVMDSDLDRRCSGESTSSTM